MTSAVDIVNQAIQYIGDNQPPVTGNAPNFDSSAAGTAARQVYAATVATVQRQWEWDASRSTVLLIVTGNLAPYPWSFEYGYPPNGIEVWEISPTAGDVNDPLPYDFVVANALVGGNQVRVIHSNLNPALAIYNNNPNENTWDAGFREAVVRLLASTLSMAIAGKPDLALALLESGGQFGSGAAERQN